MAVGSVVFDERLTIPADVFDLSGFCRWVHSDGFPQNGRFSFLDGQVDVQMSPEEIATHNQAKGDVYATLWQWIRQERLGHLLADRTLLVNEAANLSTEPDMTFCSYESLRQGRVKYRELHAGSERYVEVTGSPDLIVEIVSVSSVRKDKQTLPRLYFAAGVLEYWCIDARGELIVFDMLTRGAEGYVRATPDADGYLHSQVFHRRFFLERIDDPVIGFLYTLHVK